MPATGKYCNVLLTFDFDADSAEQRRSPDKPVKLSKGQFGPRVGISRVLRLLAKYRINSTFFIPGWTADTYTDAVQRIIKAGHEVAAHGYLHENLSELGEDEERRVFKRMIGALRKQTGAKPIGFRAPHWEFSGKTLQFITDFGFKYDSSLMSDEKPYLLNVNGIKILELPVEWFLDDWPLFEIERRSPQDVFDIWRSEFDAIGEEGVPYFMLTMHPQCIGRASRTGMLEDLINHMKRRKVRFVTCRDLLSEHKT